MASDLLRALGLYAGQELLLLQLRDHDGCSQQDLVATLGLDHSTVTKMLQRLERAGMVAREPSAADRRATLVRLTPEGRRLCGKVEDIWTQLEEATVSSLSSRQRQQLRQLLALVEGGLRSGGPRRPLLRVDHGRLVEPASHRQVAHLSRMRRRTVMMASARSKTRR